MKRRSVLLLLAAAMLVGACGSDGEVIDRPARFAALAELTGPWRPTPFRLDPVIRERVAETCRRDIEVPGSVPAVMDARGAGVVTVRMTGARAGACDALEITLAGGVASAGGGWGQAGPERLPLRDDGTLEQIQRGQIGGGNLDVQGWSVYGTAGLAIARVEVAIPSGEIVTATLEDGWFSAWWQAIIPDDPFGMDPFPPGLDSRLRSRRPIARLGNLE